MSERQSMRDPVDARLDALFDGAAASIADDGFSAAVLARIGRTDLARAVTLGVAGGLGAVIAATQLGAAAGLFVALSAGASDLAGRAPGLLAAAPGVAGLDIAALAGAGFGLAALTVALATR